LLSPSAHTESGYRLYTDADLLTLQHILALKYLGFSLEEIRRFLRKGPQQLAAVLVQQREILQEKRRQIDSIITAIEHTETLLAQDRFEWESILRVIQVIQMEQKSEWVRKYFRDDQLETMQQLSEASYSEEARATLAQRGTWTEADQERANAQWAYVATESQRLADAGAAPDGDEAQALAKFKSDLLFAFTQGDPDVEAGLARFWDNHNALPAEERPLAGITPATVLPGADDPAARLLDAAMAIYRERQAAS